MGRFWEGIAKIGRTVGNVAGTVGKVAGLLSGIPGIGAVASTVANVANPVNKVANAGVGLIEQGQQIAKGPGTTAEKIVNTGKAIYNTADNLSGGAVSKGVNQMINQGKQAITVNAGQGGRLGSAGRGNGGEGGGQFRTHTIRF